MLTLFILFGAVFLFAKAGSSENLNFLHYFEILLREHRHIFMFLAGRDLGYD